MTSIKYGVQLIFMCLFCIGFAQKTAVYSNEAVNFQSALSLYNARQYQSAQLLFKSVESTTNDAFLKSNACNNLVAFLISVPFNVLPKKASGWN